MEDSAQYEEFSNLHAESERNKRVKENTYKGKWRDFTHRTGSPEQK